MLASPVGPRICLAPEDGGGSGGGAASPQGGAGGQEKPSGTAEGVAAAAAPARPEGLDDRYWDATAGVKLPDLLKDHRELAAFKATEDSRRAAAPDAPDKYELKLPADHKLPEGVKWEFDANDPMLALGRQVAHQAGLDQPGFEKLVAQFVDMQLGQAKQAQEFETAAVKAQNDVLGPKADERRNAAIQWLGAKYGPQAAEMMKPMLNVAPAVQLFERIMGDLRGSGAGFTAGGRDTAAEKGVPEDKWSTRDHAANFTEALKQQGIIRPRA